MTVLHPLSRQMKNEQDRNTKLNRVKRLALNLPNVIQREAIQDLLDEWNQYSITDDLPEFDYAIRLDT